MSSYSTKPNPWSGIPLVGTLIDAIQTYLHTTIDTDISSAIAAASSPPPTWYTGSVAPTTLHNNGDYYVLTTNGEVYKQVSGAWVDQGFVLPAGAIPDGIVTSAKIATGAVGSTQIATGAVTTTQIADGTIVDGDISASAAMAISKLAGFPNDVTKALLGDGTWNRPGTTATRFTPIGPRSHTEGNNVLAFTANDANAMLFYNPSTISITNFYHSVILTGGNYDFGIYDTSFNAIWRYGGHVMPAASTTVAITVPVANGTPNTSPLVLKPGWYYLVSAADNTTAQTATFTAAGNSTSANRSGLSGVAALDAKPVWWRKASSYPLPASFASVTAYVYDSSNIAVLLVDGV